MKVVNMGGQAVIEGVMIKAEHYASLAVRKKDGSISVTGEEIIPLKEKHKIAGWPIIRGVVNLCSQLALGYRMLTKSAYLAEGEEEQDSEWMGVFAGVLAIVLAVGLFMLLPSFLASWLFPTRTIWMNLTEGGIRILIFVGYMAAVSIMKDMRRVFMYHGAEHRVLHCIEHELEPTVENTKKFKVVHPRCGTSYMFLVMVVSILVFSLLGGGDTIWIRAGLRIVLLPLVAGLAYEVLKLAARFDGIGARIIRTPGLWLQHLSTRIPDDDMVEVAAAAYADAFAGEERYLAQKNGEMHD